MYINSHLAVWFALFVRHFQFGWSVVSEYYESVEWTPQNHKFHFPKETIQNGEAYHRLSVSPSAKMIVICPHPSTYLHDQQQEIPNEQRYEAVWHVDKQSFLDCKVGNRIGNINRLWLRCDTPMEKLKYDTLVFQRFSADPGSLKFPPGTEHYFIATSDGTKDSLNNTSGGHCDDVANDISMKMMIYVCSNKADPACNVKTDPPPSTNTTETTESTVIPGPATQASRKSASWDTWHLLTIIFGVSFAVSLIILSVCLFVVCRRTTANTTSSETHQLHPEGDENGMENIQIDNTKKNYCRA